MPRGKVPARDQSLSGGWGRREGARHMAPTRSSRGAAANSPPQRRVMPQGPPPGHRWLHPTSRGPRLSPPRQRAVPQPRGMLARLLREGQVLIPIPAPLCAQGGERQPQPRGQPRAGPFCACPQAPRRGSPQKYVKLAFQHNAQALNTNLLERGWHCCLSPGPQGHLIISLAKHWALPRHSAAG